jgi:hypothetical protein
MNNNDVCRPAFAGPLFSEGFFRESRKMPPIPEIMIKSATFLFRTKDEAKRRVKIGGTAFLVTKPIEGSLERAGHQLYIPYLITNRHVVYAGGSSVVSINRRDGLPPDIFEYEPTDWTVHPSGDDVAAICVVNDIYNQVHDITPIRTEHLMRPQDVKNSGVGEDVVMVGRFVNHQGTNKSSVRPIWQHQYDAGKNLGESRQPISRKLCR